MIKIFFPLLVLISCRSYAESQPRYPIISGIKGPVKLYRDDQEVPLVRLQILREKALFRLGPKGILKIALSPTASIEFSENTEVSIPSILWDDGSIEKIELRKGEVHYSCLQSCPKIALETPLSYESLMEGESVWSYDPQKPQIKLIVLQGTQHFRGLEVEEDVLLKEADQAQFTGVFEEGKPAFDILLKGRKVARGKLEKLPQLTKSEISKWVATFSQNQKDLSRLSATPKKEKKKVIRSEKVICQKPDGEFNQCAWICENNPKGSKGCQLSNPKVQCVRKKCDANGVWTDRTVISREQSPCSANVIVKSCDY